MPRRTGPTPLSPTLDRGEPGRTEASDQPGPDDRCCGMTIMPGTLPVDEVEDFELDHEDLHVKALTTCFFQCGDHLGGFGA